MYSAVLAGGLFKKSVCLYICQNVSLYPQNKEHFYFINLLNSNFVHFGKFPPAFVTLVLIFRTHFYIKYT